MTLSQRFISTFFMPMGVVLVLILISSQVRCEEEEGELDLLEPYDNFLGRRAKKSHRHIRECQEIKYGNVTHSKMKAHSDVNLSYPLVQIKHLNKEFGQYYYNKKTQNIRYQRVDYPTKTLSVLEPLKPGSCVPGKSARATTTSTSINGNCIVAVNAGFFNTTTGACLGNIISDGRFVQDSGGVQNVHFGITEDGYIYVGYLSELDLLVQHFKQLVGGVLWLVRNGEKYLEQSKRIECPDIQETGTLDRFINVQSARSAVGHDREGRVIMVQVDGKTDSRGVNLNEFADLLLELGVYNAINLDGGGSVTSVINHTLVNYPSDKCPKGPFNCERKISTILCVHEPKCEPEDCNDHGKCVLGNCVCNGYWTGSDCSRLSCPDNCSSHGMCTEKGCICDGGWSGYNCSFSCLNGFYGVNCSNMCYCLNNGSCDKISGKCQCSSGFTGKYCESVCPYGYYGNECNDICTCDNGCFCNPITGSCNLSTLTSDLHEATSCLIEADIKSNNLIEGQSHQYSLCLSSVIGLGILATFSIILNISFISVFVLSKKRHKKERKETLRPLLRSSPAGSDENTE